MTLSVHLFPCLADNYGFLIRDEATGRTAAVDTPDADRILQEMARLGWDRLDLILNTHWHPDHTQGNVRLQAETGCRILGPEEVLRVAPLDQVLKEGDTVELGEARFEVIETPGHTLGHIVYRAPVDAIAFTGDTLFTLGCGRLFEGTPEQMWRSLRRIAAWPDGTVLYGAHEYTAGNARFMLSLDDRPETAAHARDVFEQRERGEPTVPTTLSVERAFNPFLRAATAEAFAEVRAAKDAFRG